MRHLDRFLTKAKSQGNTLVQDFSPDSVLIRRSEILLPVDKYSPD